MISTYELFEGEKIKKTAKAVAKYLNKHKRPIKIAATLASAGMAGSHYTKDNHGRAAIWAALAGAHGATIPDRNKEKAPA